MLKCAPHVWLSNNAPFPGGMRPLRQTTMAGLTLIELVVALAILSILAAAALPSVEVMVMRTKEIELHRVLREVRTAIDSFHEDWVSGKISKTNSYASEDGYPRNLRALVDGIEASNAKGGKRRYLRRIPRDPFADAGKLPEESWVVRGYQDDMDTTIWGGKDVYDIHSASAGIALDGTRYRDW